MKKIALLTLLLIIAGTLTACYPRLGGSRYFDAYDSSGEQIYYTARSSSGDPITSTGGISMMRSNACVDCHGRNGKGGTVNMMMWSFEAPDITWGTLTSVDEHEEHPPFDEASVKIAILEGLNPAGEPLDQEMPRWQMSPRDLQDLVNYLKTLE